MRFASLLAALPSLCLALGAAVADDGAAGRGHALGADLALLSPTAASPLAHPGQSLEPVAAVACQEDCLPAEVALDR